MQRHLGGVVAGGLAGMVGAACMSLAAVAGAIAAGKGWYAPLELAGGLATGSNARFDAGVQSGTAVAGALLPFLLGFAWGALFGLIVTVLVGEMMRKDAIWIGAFFGIFVWVIDLFAVVPRIDPAAARAIPLWFGAFIHIGFGMVLGVEFLYLARKLGVRLHEAAGPQLHPPH